MITEILQLTRLNVPVGSLLLLWPTIAALWIVSGGIPPLDILLIFILGTVVMRSAGCTINDIADRNIDGQVKRTTKRPLADGRLSVATAWVVFACLALIALALVLQLNQTTQVLAVFGFAIVVVYPFVKRVSMLPQLVLGLAFSWGIPLAATAVSDKLIFSWPTVVLFISNFFWIVAYDTLYAMVDRDDDQHLGVGSTALLFGESSAAWVTIFLAITWLLWLVLGLLLKGSWSYYLFMVVIAVILGYQIVQAIQPNNHKGWFQAFRSNMWVGTALFIGVFLSTPGQVP